MQKFRVVLSVTVNTISDEVSSDEVREEVKSWLDNFDGGVIEIVECDEE